MNNKLPGTSQSQIIIKADHQSQRTVVLLIALDCYGRAPQKAIDPIYAVHLRYILIFEKAIKGGKREYI
jgi:hypothetical protein